MEPLHKKGLTHRKYTKRAPLLTKILKDHSYEESVLNLGLNTLQRRRERNDLIHMHKTYTVSDQIA